MGHLPELWETEFHILPLPPPKVSHLQEHPDRWLQGILRQAFLSLFSEAAVLRINTQSGRLRGLQAGTLTWEMHVPVPVTMNSFSRGIPKAPPGNAHEAAP